ncbi:hypothetical protein HOLleu_44931 [Holothuria leucospilota]|uniref:Uncharacterized protein n=1 Tax=Holothuria leucospilota TaxID=206669 RepID=A0A9Q1BAL6_HOLLE|nr:hypothetical protein HOLleu_44931 [Holothuria leucospilota]
MLEVSHVFDTALVTFLQDEENIAVNQTIIFRSSESRYHNPRKVNQLFGHRWQISMFFSIWLFQLCSVFGKDDNITECLEINSSFN